MSNRFIFAALATAAIMTAIPVAQAHHSVAMFDTSKQVLIEGTVKEWQFTNPHAWLQVMIDHDGKQVEAGFEARSPNALMREGFELESFKPGDKVKVLAAPRRDGSVGGMMLCARTATGKWLGSDPGSKSSCHD
jgi:hypothetical protein